MTFEEFIDMFSSLSKGISKLNSNILTFSGFLTEFQAPNILLTISEIWYYPESSPACRAQWAFKIFDYDNDGLLSSADIRWWKRLFFGKIWISKLYNFLISAIFSWMEWKLYIFRKVVDAITGTDLAAFGEKLREDVVFQVLEWDSTFFQCPGSAYSTSQNYNLLFSVHNMNRKFYSNPECVFLRETDYNRTGAISLPEFSQMVTKSVDFQNNFCLRL